MHNWWRTWQATSQTPLPKPPPSRPPPGLQENNVRDAKRRRLQEYTHEILNEPWKLDSDIIQYQKDCFQEYEETIQILNKKITYRDNCLFDQKKSTEYIQKAYAAKCQMVRKKSSENSNLRSIQVTLHSQIEALSLQMAQIQSEHEESVTHYKNLIKGLEKTAANSEESSQYIRMIKKLLIDYSKGEKLEDALHCTERVCSICMDNSALVVCKPCNHLEFCYACAIDAFKLDIEAFESTTDVDVSGTCPRCKQDVKEVHYIYT